MSSRRHNRSPTPPRSMPPLSPTSSPSSPLQSGGWETVSIRPILAGVRLILGRRQRRARRVPCCVLPSATGPLRIGETREAMGADSGRQCRAESCADRLSARVGAGTGDLCRRPRHLGLGPGEPACRAPMTFLSAIGHGMILASRRSAGWDARSSGKGSAMGKPANDRFQAPARPFGARAQGPVLGDWVRTARTSQGISQRALADRSGLSRSYLCDIERGRGAQPSVTTLDKLAKALGASRADLLRIAGILEPSGRLGDERERRFLTVFRDLGVGAGRGRTIRPISAR